MDAGVSRGLIETRIAGGQLLRLHRGVYAVGHRRLRREGHWLAAVLAVGPEAVLSHRDAAALHGLRQAERTAVDVTTSQRGRRGQPRIDVHHSRTLSADDIEVSESGIPVTNVSRTLVDLAAVVSPHQIAKALGEAERKQLLDVDALAAGLARTACRRGPGHARLRNALAEHGRHGALLTRSHLEDRFHLLIRRHRLPRPHANVRVEGFEVDALWPERRVVVELDGYVFHADRRSFQRDRTKGNALTRAGYTLLRYTYDDVVERPQRIAAQLRPLLTPAPPAA